MRRSAAFGLVVALVLLVAAPALGAPTNGANTEFISVTCDGATRHVYVRGNAAWGANATGTLDGTQFVLKEIAVRVYPGNLTTQPTTDPLFFFAQTYGKKTGLGQTIRCTFREVETGEFGITTAFGVAWVVQIR